MTSPSRNAGNPPAGGSFATPPSDAPLTRRHYRAPTEDGATLIDPPLAELPLLLDANVAALEQQGAGVICDRPYAAFASEARRELLDAAWEYTRAFCEAPRPANGSIVMAGHQPTMFHAGVWFKNFVLNRVAARRNAAAVNLIVDADLAARPSLRVPVRNDAGFAEIPFDAPADPVPHEVRDVVDRATFASFGERTAAAMREWGVDAKIREYWPRVLDRHRAGERLGACLAQARRQLEGTWGVSNFEFPQSRLCELPAFWRFAAHLLAESDRFREVYNAAVLEYRRLNKVRSANHPAPELARHDAWVEAPFWIWTDDAPRRRPLFVAVRGDRLLLSNRGAIKFEAPRSASGNLDVTAEALGDLPRRGIRLRTRALTTTLYARLVLCDLFIHGIGGGKYDTVVDAIASRFFGFVAPRFAVATATLRLPNQHAVESQVEPQIGARALRELIYHPERCLDGDGSSQPSPEALEIIATKRRWIAAPVTRENARERCLAIRFANERLQPLIAQQRQALERELARAAIRTRRRAAHTSREYAWCLHPPEKIREFMTGI